MTVLHELHTEQVILMPSLSRSEVRTEFLRFYEMFNLSDDDKDGYLEKEEVENLIRSNPDKFDDVNELISEVTERMNFEQFLELVDNAAINEDNDNGNGFHEYIESSDNFGIMFRPKGFTFYVPIMLVLSIIQITCFMYDFITWNVDKDVKTEEGNVHFDGSIDYMNGKLAKEMKVGINSTEYYRYITYQFTHSDNMHIFGDILFQLLLGIPLEFMHGSWRVIVVYLAGVLSESVGHVNFENSFLGGATGGVYAIITAHVASVLMNWKAMPFAFIRLLAFLAYIANEAYSRYKDHQEQQKFNPGGSSVTIAYLSGSIAGLLVGIGILHDFKSKSYFKRVLFISCIIIYCSLMSYGILLIDCIRGSNHNLNFEENRQFCYNKLL